MPGQTLHDRLAQNALTGREVVSLIIGLAGALAVVHHAGIVHRDIKPANVLLRPIRHGVVPFRPVLVDFGVAHLLDAARVTSPGVVIGTASYPAPEQVRGEPTVPASDIYALGLLTIEALTGTKHPSSPPLRRVRRHLPTVSDAAPTLEAEVAELLGLVVVLVVTVMTILGAIMLACAASAPAAETEWQAQAAAPHARLSGDSRPNSADAARRMCASVRSAARPGSPSSMAA